MGYRKHTRAVIGWRKLDSAMVNGEPWCTVHTSRTVGEWVRTHDKSLWIEIDDRVFDMHEKLLVLLTLTLEPNT